ncbi:uncharacterized protein LOC135199300 [Macrobrachium nipponense]|uniref:uncharacterized protein LOC135199300 n=1 Tax=Macrobrachium nipponense TaxID=159736 RepID=UPI0030C7A67E
MHLASVTLSRAPKKPFLKTTQDSRLNVIQKGITVYKETAAEVNDRIESNNKMVGGLEGFVQTLDEMKLSTTETLSNIARDNKLLSDKMDMMKGKLQPMKDLEDKLEAATDFASATGPMDEAQKLLQEVDDGANEIKRLLQENKDNMKQDTLRIEGTFTEAMKDLGRMIEELEGVSVVNITVTDLQSPHGRLRGDAQREIFAVMTFKGKLRLAPVKIESNNQVSFTHLGRRRSHTKMLCHKAGVLDAMVGSPSPPLSPPFQGGSWIWHMDPPRSGGSSSGSLSTA